MSTFGMQMPGGRARRASLPDVYTALLGIATVALLIACAFVYVQGGKIGANGSAIGIQEEGNIAIER